MSKIVIQVEDGTVQAVYYNGREEIEVEVLDYYISNYASKSEQEEYDAKIEELEKELHDQGMEEIY